MTFAVYVAGAANSSPGLKQQALIDQVLRLAQQTAVLKTNQLLLNRYHTALDNQLYRALKALRETQQWRLSTLEPVAKRA